jgi:DNA excision repair protein ERCC-2
MRATSKPPVKYAVAVRALCEFTAKHGDLDLRFTPSPSAQEGMAGHALVVSRRDEGYQSEVSLAGEYKGLVVRGRADGYDPAKNQLEEVKTYRGDLHGIAENRRQLHWAQAKIYGWLLCQEKGLQDITLALVYLDLASLQETTLAESFTATELEQYFQSQCELFLVWARQEAAHRAARDEALTSLAFPHDSFRPGQRDLAEAVYKTTQAGRCLMAQATTGIGKTIGTVYPLLKAAPRQRLDKLFFLAAKTPGRKLALDALALVKDSSPGLPLRVMELVAREKSCEHPDKACHGDSCPLASGFYDRLPAARSAAVGLAAGTDLLGKSEMRAVALAHHICPYYLSQELVRWCDVVVGDYNYYFDSSAQLYNLATTSQWRVSVLVDEAHNLLERGRKMYSAQLDQSRLHEVHASAPKAVKKPLERLDRALAETHQVQTEGYAVHAELPAGLSKALLQAITAITDFLVANPTRVDADLQDFYFEVLHFSRMAEAFGAHSIFDITLNDDGQATGHQDTGMTALIPQASHGCATLTIRNVVPAPFLMPRFAAAHSVTLFSATLSPQQFYLETLGLPAGTAWIDVQSPFKAEQLRVAAVSNISTRYQHREHSLHPIADLMARQYDKAPGNYLAFLSSYDYLQKLGEEFRKRYPHIPVWEQTRQMDEAGREQFLNRFTADSRGIGFAVLGGAFAEGVDLPGKRLIGAFIATLGLPQINVVNEQIRLRMGTYFEKEDSRGEGYEQDGEQGSGTPAGNSQERGYNYTYLYPGLQKVVQAAGRVIRTQSDRGVIYLMDDRFTRPEVMQLLPDWWAVERLFAPRSGIKA